MKLLPIIGHPGYQTGPDGAGAIPGCDDWKDLMDKSLQLVYITPLDTKISKSINIYEGRNAWDPYVEYLQAHGIQPGENAANRRLTVACNNITPLSESYSNEFGQSELFGAMQNISSGSLQEAAFLGGYQGESSLRAGANSQNDVVSSLSKMGIGLLDTVENTAKGIGFSDKNAKTLREGLANPTQKIDIPSMWKGNSFSAQYELSIRLQCFNASITEDYENRIVAPLAALMMFCCPRSKTGNFYQWPFLMEFEIPGLVDLPLAYCSNLTVVKGGDVNDLSWIWRANVVDLRMTINTVWGVTVNTLENGDVGSKPTILKQIEIMQKRRGDTSMSDINSASRSNSPSTTGSSREASSGMAEADSALSS